MDPTRLAPESIDGEKKRAAIQDAKDMQQAVIRSCARANCKVPAFEFIELIGKGASGRVYKCRDQTDDELVAVKIVDTDTVDYGHHTLDKDDTIKDFLKEVNTLQQLKDARAKNINMIKQAFDIQEQLWIVCEYCTGGSIRTLMRANPPGQPGLEEEFIIPIARELAIGIRNVHSIGVIHRDIKCTNVYVTEDGEIQVGDFGIVGVLDEEGSKRKTIIGTPHYMPIEMLPVGPDTGGNQAPEAYGREVDIWSFGCSVYEMATGLPPNARQHPSSLSTVLVNAPRLEEDDYSQELRDFVAFCLNSSPTERPTAEEVLKHPYIAGTFKQYPTDNLVKLIQRYKAWEYSGGWRQSLFMAGGAPPVPGSEGSPTTDVNRDLDDWNFSTSDTFNADFGRRYSMMMDKGDNSDLTSDSSTATNLPPIITKGLTGLTFFEKHQQEISASRGEKSLERLWNPHSAPYELHEPVDIMEGDNDDLPLRRMTADAPTRESLIDLDSAGEMDMAVPTINFDFSDQPTVRKSRAIHTDGHDEDDDSFQYGEAGGDLDKRATMEWKFPTVKKAAIDPKRATMDWKFPTNDPGENSLADFDVSLETIGETDDFISSRPPLNHTATMPLGQFGDYVHTQRPDLLPHSSMRDSNASLIDLDSSFMDSNDFPRPSTATSATGSTMTDATSGNPFDLEEDPEQNEADRKRFSHHKQWQSEGGQSKRGSSRRSVPMHARGNSLSSTDDEGYDNTSGSDRDVFAYQYNRQLSERIGGHALNGSIDVGNVDVATWPSFGKDSGFDEVRQWTDDLDVIIAQQSLASRTIDMPKPIPPASNVMIEDAHPELMEAEMERLLGDMEMSLAGLGKALKISSERIAGVESEDETEDDETF